MSLVILVVIAGAFYKALASGKTSPIDTTQNRQQDPAFDAELASKTDELKVLLNPTLSGSEAKYFEEQQARYVKEQAAERQKSNALKTSRDMMSSNMSSNKPLSTYLKTKPERGGMMFAGGRGGRVTNWSH